MDVRAFRALRDAGATWAEIARATGHDWRTVKKYLSVGAPARPPEPPRRGRQARVIDPYAEVIDEWLRRAPRLRASVIHERLVGDYGFTGHYQRVKCYVREARARLGLEDRGELHRRFEVLPGAQAQVDWGEEGVIETPSGPLGVSSFHMTLSYSRDPFCCYVAAKDLATFWDCHRRAFAHFGGVPASIVYDRTKTVVKAHVGRGQDTPLHPEAIAFAVHYDFAIVLAPPQRPQFKGRVERQVDIVRAGVLCGRSFSSLAEMDGAFMAWLPGRRAKVHRTHGEVIAVRAERDHAALAGLPERPYVVAERHLRKVAKDCLISFEASCYSVPWRQVRARMTVEVRAGADALEIWTVGADPELLARHRRAERKGSWVVDERHWEGLPERGEALPPCTSDAAAGDQALEPEWSRIPKAATAVATRDLTAYDLAGGAR